MNKEEIAKLKKIKLPKPFHWVFTKNYIFIDSEEYMIGRYEEMKKIRGEIDKEVSAIAILSDGGYRLEWENGDNTVIEPFDSFDELIQELEIRMMALGH